MFGSVRKMVSAFETRKQSRPSCTQNTTSTKPPDSNVYTTSTVRTSASVQSTTPEPLPVSSRTPSEAAGDGEPGTQEVVLRGHGGAGRRVPRVRLRDSWPVGNLRLLITVETEEPINRRIRCPPEFNRSRLRPIHCRSFSTSQLNTISTTGPSSTMGPKSSSTSRLNTISTMGPKSSSTSRLNTISTMGPKSSSTSRPNTISITENPVGFNIMFKSPSITGSIPSSTTEPTITSPTRLNTGCTKRPVSSSIANPSSTSFNGPKFSSSAPGLNTNSAIKPFTTDPTTTFTTGLKPSTNTGTTTSISVLRPKSTSAISSSTSGLITSSTSVSTLLDHTRTPVTEPKSTCRMGTSFISDKHAHSSTGSSCSSMTRPDVVCATVTNACCTPGTGASSSTGTGASSSTGTGASSSTGTGASSSTGTGTTVVSSGRGQNRKGWSSRPELQLRPSDSTLLSLLLFLRSGSSTSMVAIDNKIEQAMDLVKAHLMMAVREEVEVLREQIKELTEKNAQLERENYILKALRDQH